MKNRTGAIIIILILIILFLSGQLQAQVPRIDSVFPLKGSIGGLMTIKGKDMNYSKTVNVGNTSELIISENDTEVVVMIMPGTQTGYIKIISFSNGQSIYADNFVVVASSLPNKQLGKKLYDSSGTSPLQGYSVAMSADGSTAAVGAGYDTGGVLIYTRNNNIWTRQGNKLIGTNAAGKAAQGFSVSLSADGNTLIEGGVADNYFTGAVWIFTRDKNGVWSQQGNKLIGANSIGGTTPEQGYAVSISADGNTAIVGGRRDSDYVGAAWIFTRSNNAWSEQQKLIGTGYIININVQGYLVRHSVQMGSAVAMSADGSTAVVGGPNDNNDTGAVWVFKRNANVWSQQGNKLVGTGEESSYLGNSQQGYGVAISADGNTIIEGGPFDTDVPSHDVNTNLGAIWIFTRNGNTWGQQGNKLYPTDITLGAEFGWSVSLSADGNTAFVGSPGDSVYVGGARIFTRTNNVWQQSSGKLLGTGYLGAPKQGWSAAISADGNTAIVGGPEDYQQGGAWVFADTSNIILATNFTNFSAYIFNKGIQTSWTGVDETNLSNYVIERSADGYHFIVVGNVLAKTNASKNNYTWFDASPLIGNNFYRIKAINKDGSFQYSSTIKINFDNKVQGSITVYPNPSNNKIIHLQLNNIAEGNYNISVYNTNGEMLYRQGFQHTGNETSVTINLKNAAAGMYKIEMKNNNNGYNATAILQ